MIRTSLSIFIISKHNTINERHQTNQFRLGQTIAERITFRLRITKTHRGSSKYPYSISHGQIYGYTNNSPSNNLLLFKWNNAMQLLWRERSTLPRTRSYNRNFNRNERPKTSKYLSMDSEKQLSAWISNIVLELQQSKEYLWSMPTCFTIARCVGLNDSDWGLSPSCLSYTYPVIINIRERERARVKFRVSRKVIYYQNKSITCQWTYQQYQNPIHILMVPWNTTENNLTDIIKLMEKKIETNCDMKYYSIIVMENSNASAAGKLSMNFLHWIILTTMEILYDAHSDLPMQNYDQSNKTDFLKDIECSAIIVIVAERQAMIFAPIKGFSRASSLSVICDFNVIHVKHVPLCNPTNPRWDYTIKYIYNKVDNTINGEIHKHRKYCRTVRGRRSNRNPRSNWHLCRTREEYLRTQPRQIIHTTYDCGRIEEEKSSSIICKHQQHLKKIGNCRNPNSTEGWPIQILQMEPTIGGLFSVNKLLLIPPFTFQTLISALLMFYLMLADLEKFLFLGARYA